MSQFTKEKAIEFLAELAELTHIYGIEISACGCCNSPWITGTNDLSGEYRGKMDDELDSLVSIDYCPTTTTTTS